MGQSVIIKKLSIRSKPFKPNIKSKFQAFVVKE